MRVCTWNLFHGRARPPERRDLVDAFAAALDAQPWDVCGLQEVPPWWARELGEALGASVRTARTSLARAAFPGWQERTHRADPERLGVAGAGANVLLVRPSAGEILTHREATLRRLPQRRTLHAVELVRPGGARVWVGNVHTHNRPESRAALDTIAALRTLAAWSRATPAVLLGDLNLAAPEGLAAVEGWTHLHGHRVDHVVGRGVEAAPGGTFAEVAQLSPETALSDHRIVGLRVTIP